MAFSGALWEGFTEGLTAGLGLCEGATRLGRELGPWYSQQMENHRQRQASGKEHVACSIRMEAKEYLNSENTIYYLKCQK